MADPLNGFDSGTILRNIAQAPPPVAAPPNLLDQTKQEFPILGQYDIAFKNSPNSGQQGWLESWPAGETGSDQYKRPAELPPDKFGVEIYRQDTKPLDVLGDIVSHHLVDVDPTIRSTYENFQKSLQPWQQDRLKEQYEHAKKEEGETRSFDEWKKASGLPAYFRGYPFKQWENAGEMYTPDQLKMLDGMMDYLRGGKAH